MVVRLLCYKSQKTLVLRYESFLSEPTGLVYHHALVCIKKAFAMMIYKTKVLLICNGKPLIYFRFFAIIHLKVGDFFEY